MTATAPERSGRGHSTSPAAPSTRSTRSVRSTRTVFTTRRRRARQAMTAASVLLLPFASAACASSSDPPDPPDPPDPAATEAAKPNTAPGWTATNDPTGVVLPGPLTCESHPPGVVLSREQAIVQFDPERVCPGYITVLVGTPVSFVNQGDASATVTVAETATTGELGATLLDVTVRPGDYVEYTPVATGFLSFATDALPSFRGTVEVQAAEPT